MAEKKDVSITIKATESLKHRMLKAQLARRMNESDFVRTAILREVEAVEQQFEFLKEIFEGSVPSDKG